jgi:inhibitor of KinA
LSGSYKIFPLGDSAITVDFGKVIDEKINHKVIALFQYWRDKKLIGVKDIIPAYCSLTIVYDAALIRNLAGVTSAYSFIKDHLEHSINDFDWKKKTASALKEIPVCYHHSLAPDLKTLAGENKLTEEEVIQLHGDRVYRVYMIGFLPGFAYMGKVDKRIATPRKINPRALVHSGSVGIAGEHTGIYPFDSPGGWNIIGQTPLLMFDEKRKDPVLLNAGDKVKFIPITVDEFQHLKSRQ